MVGYVYMMSDKPRGVIYIGVTSDLQGRVWEHKNEATRGYTSKYKAKLLVWYERHPNIVLAIKREKVLKQYIRDWKMNLIEGFNPTWADMVDKIDVIDNPFIPKPASRLWNDYN